MRNIALATLTVVLSLATAGCAMPRFERIKAPAVRVTDVRVTEQTDEGSVVVATVELQNPNRAPLPLTRNSYSVTVAGKTFSFKDRPQRILPSLGTQTVEIPAAFATGGRDLTGAAFSVNGSIKYHPPGQFRRFLTESGVPLPSVSYRQSGALGSSN